MNEPREKRDLVLPPGTYAYMQDVTKGVIKVYTGPTVINPTAQERPVRYERGQFRPCDLESAMCLSPVAVEGFYLTLLNPAQKDVHPNDGTAQAAPELDVGRKINIPGPAMFALWPGQSATVTRGHHLRYNQYLLVRVYNDEEARENWGKGVMKPAAPQGGEGTPAPEQASLTAVAPKDLTLGKLYIIKGTEYSFYIPPTGITVVQDEKGEYVRDALTLERLEYSILIDEDGTKRYEYGPKVVFPEPTEKFFKAKGRGDGTKDNEFHIKFRAIELNPIQGLHVKVIADYEDGEGEKKVLHKTGEELFITGTETSIYYPREEHAIIKYDGKTKHFATAIPAGEGRYVLNRQTGAIRMVKGPAMLLPDPRSEVIVRRVLTDKQCELWYPGNSEALQINRELRNVLQKSPTTRAGAVSEGDIERAQLKSMARNSTGSRGGLDKYNTLIGTAATMAFGDASQVSGDQFAAGDEISRGSTYTQPRSITLDTKYQGAPNISVWTGYAVMVVDKQGGRRVEVGPKNILLEYDEDLEVLSMSTGKPKTTDKLYQTVYLRTENNSVTDILDVETLDHVNVRLKLNYRVNFTENFSGKWFSVENYVKFLCDHVRSILKGVVRKQKVESFYTDATEFIRSTILGESKDGVRPGMKFPENGLEVDDVEVLSVDVIDPEIKALLNGFQQQTVRTNIDLAATRRAAEVEAEKLAIQRERDTEQAETAKLKNQLNVELEASAFAVKLAQLGNALANAAKQAEVDAATAKNEAAKVDSRLENERKAAEQRLKLAETEQAQRLTALKAETEATVARLAQAKEGFSEALLALSNNETLAKVAEAWSIQRVIGGESVSDALSKVFAGSPLEGVMKKLTQAPAATSAQAFTR